MSGDTIAWGIVGLAIAIAAIRWLIQMKAEAETYG